MMRKTVTIFLASNFMEFKKLRQVLTVYLAEKLDHRANIQNLHDSQARPDPPLDESLRRVRESDLCVVLIGDSYGGVPPHNSKSFTHLEYEEALGSPDTELLVFMYEDETLLSNERDAPREREPSDTLLAEWREHAKLNCTVATIPRSTRKLRDARDQIADNVQRWLLHKLAEEADAVAAASDTASSFSLGPAIRTSAHNRWNDAEISHLDLEIMGIPQRRATVAEAGLVAQANDEWNEACKAFRIEASDIMMLHLERSVELRPLDGETRYWLARLQMTKFPGSTTGHLATAARAGTRAPSIAARNDGAHDTKIALKRVADGAMAAARVFDSGSAEDDDPAEKRVTRRAGLAWLLAAKAQRRQLDYSLARASARNAREGLGWHSEVHMELSLASAGLGDEDQAIASARRAFRRHIYVMDPLREYLEQMDEQRLHQRISETLATEVAGDIKKMWGFRTDLNRFLNAPADDDVTAESDLATNDPVALAEEAQYLAVENLDRTRDAELVVRSKSDELMRAESVTPVDHRSEVDASLFDVARLLKWSLVVAFLAGVVLVGLSRQPVVGLVGALLTMALATWFAVTKKRENGRRVEAAAEEHARSVNDREKAVDNARAAFTNAATGFEILCMRYESAHLGSKHYSPGPPPRTASNGDPVRLKRNGPRILIESDDALSPDLRERLGVWAVPGADKNRFGLYEVVGKGSSKSAVRWRVYRRSTQ